MGKKLLQNNEKGGEVNIKIPKEAVLLARNIGHVLIATADAKGCLTWLPQARSIWPLMRDL